MTNDDSRKAFERWATTAYDKYNLWDENIQEQCFKAWQAASRLRAEQSKDMVESVAKAVRVVDDHGAEKTYVFELSAARAIAKAAIAAMGVAAPKPTGQHQAEQPRDIVGRLARFMQAAFRESKFRRLGEDIPNDVALILAEAAITAMGEGDILIGLIPDRCVKEP